MDLLAQPLASCELLVVDTETNGLGHDACELIEIGTVLVGGGELHDRWSSLVRTSAPLRASIRRLTGISAEMVRAAPPPETVVAALAQRMRGRVLVAHNAPFDRRVLRRAFERIDVEWPEQPMLCTAAMARALLPLQRERSLGALADALGIEVEVRHRALPDAETCARVLCALLPRLRAHAATVADAVALLEPRRPRRVHGARRRTTAIAERPQLEFGELPQDPGVYLFRDRAGRVLYVGKSVSIRSRARAHFAPSAAPADWTPHATIVDYCRTRSELGALVLENRLIKQLAPPGNIRLARRDDRLVYIRCRLDIPFPILEVSSEPASGHAVTVGPVRSRALALELVEQIDSLFALRHCGRRLPHREHPSAYGQMGRCLSPCLGDLDPNLYRCRLDAALRLFMGDAAGMLIDHVEAHMRAAARAQRYERAAWLQRRLGRLRLILGRLEGVLEATHARPRLVLAAHPTDPARRDAFWLVGGRLLTWGALPDDIEEVWSTTIEALRRGGMLGAVGQGGRVGAAGQGGRLGAGGQGGRLGAGGQGGRVGAVRREGRPDEIGAHVPPDEVDEVRIVGTYLASHPSLPQLVLDPPPTVESLRRFIGVEPARSQPGVAPDCRRRPD